MEKRITKISDLPVEIFIKIFEKLESPEIFKVAEVCRRWYAVTQCAAVVSKTIVYINYRFSFDVIDFFLKSSRKFQFVIRLSKKEWCLYNVLFFHKLSESILELSIKGMNLPSLEDLNLKNMKSLRMLELRTCKIPSSFDYLISNIVNLKSLKNLSLLGCTFELYTNLPGLDDLHLNLTVLRIGQNKPNVCSILSTIPNLKKLSLTFNDLNSQETVRKYLNNIELTKSLTELRIKNFYLNNNSIDLFQMNHLNLKHFACLRFSILETSKINTFLCSQMNLTYLALCNVVVNDNLIQTIFKNLLKLEVLALYNIGSETITDFGITGNPGGFPMSRLEKLKSFSLNSAYFLNISYASIRHIESIKHLKEVQLPESPKRYSSNNPCFKYTRLMNERLWRHLYINERISQYSQF